MYQLRSILNSLKSDGVIPNDDCESLRLFNKAARLLWEGDEYPGTMGYETVNTCATACTGVSFVSRLSYIKTASFCCGTDASAESAGRSSDRSIVEIIDTGFFYPAPFIFPSSVIRVETLDARDSDLVVTAVYKNRDGSIIEDQIEACKTSTDVVCSLEGFGPDKKPNGSAVIYDNTTGDKAGIIRENEFDLFFRIYKSTKAVGQIHLYGKLPFTDYSSKDMLSQFPFSLSVMSKLIPVVKSPFGADVEAILGFAKRESMGSILQASEASSKSRGRYSAWPVNLL